MRKHLLLLSCIYVQCIKPQFIHLCIIDLGVVNQKSVYLQNVTNYSNMKSPTIYEQCNIRTCWPRDLPMYPQVLRMILHW